MIYQNIKTLADKKNMSIREVERKAGLSNGSIMKWRDGSPNVKSIQLVADALGVSITRLLKE